MEDIKPCDIVWHFSHIQKTGGTSLGSHLRSFCPHERIWPHRFECPQEFYKLNQGGLRKSDFFMTPEIHAAIESNSVLDREVYSFALSNLEKVIGGRSEISF